MFSGKKPKVTLLSENASWKGHFSSQDAIELTGKMEGTLMTTEKVSIRSQGTLKGCLQAGALEIEKGAHVDVKLKIQTSQEQGLWSRWVPWSSPKK